MTTAIIIILLVAIIFFVAYGISRKRKVSSKVIKIYPHYELLPIDNEVARLINEYRVNSGLIPCDVDSFISDVAASHSQYMAKKKKVSHDYAGERQQQFPKDYVGEIVAFNYQNAASVVAGWKASPGHNNIITSDDYKKMGLAVAYDDTSKPYYTVIFTS